MIDKITCLQKGGQFISKIKPVFTSDDKFIILASYKHLLVYSCKTSLLVNKFLKHEEAIIGIQLNPNNTEEVISCSKREFIKWDPSKGLLSRNTFKLNFEPIQFIMPYKGLSVYFVGKNKNFETNFLACVNLNDFNKPIISIIFDKINIGPNSFAFSSNKSFIAAVHEAQIKIYDFESEKVITEKWSQILSAIYNDPKDFNMVFLVEEHGNIVMCPDIKDIKNQTSPHHWHYKAPKAVAIPSDGDYFYSGGKQQVLVCHKKGTNFKDFLPWLSAPIKHITVSHSSIASFTGDDIDYYRSSRLIALSMEDNSIQLVTVNPLKVKSTISGLLRCPLALAINGINQPPVNTGLVLDPNSKALVLNSNVGHLQFYNPHVNINEKNIDITKKNYISAIPGERIDRWNVHHVAFSNSGKWMITYSYRDNEDSSIVKSVMDFWWYNDVDSEFVLYHSKKDTVGAKLTALKFNAKKVEFAICCQNGETQFWEYNADETWKQKKEVKGYVGKSALDCDYNEQGTLLAVSNEIALLFWDSLKSNTKAVHTITQDYAKDVTKLLFAAKECRHILVTLSSNRLCCWNVNNLTLQYTFQINASFLVADVNSAHMALFTVDKVVIFKPNDDKPIEKPTDSIPIKNGDVIYGAIFSPRLDVVSGSDKHWSKKTNLYYLSHQQYLYQIGLKGKEDRNVVKSSMEANETPYSQVIRAKQSKENGKEVGFSLPITRPNKNGSVMELINSGVPMSAKEILELQLLEDMRELTLKRKDPENETDEVEMKNEENECKKFKFDEEEIEDYVAADFSDIFDMLNGMEQKERDSLFSNLSLNV